MSKKKKIVKQLIGIEVFKPGSAGIDSLPTPEPVPQQKGKKHDIQNI